MTPKAHLFPPFLSFCVFRVFRGLRVFRVLRGLCVFCRWKTATDLAELDTREGLRSSSPKPVSMPLQTHRSVLVHRER